MRVLFKTYGTITEDANGRTFLLEVRHDVKLTDLENVLLAWDQWGFVQWHRV